MTDHPQTATERFLRHGVAGGWEAAPDVLLPAERYDREWDSAFPGATAIVPVRMTGRPDQRMPLVSRVFVHQVLLDPALWEAAGRSLGWDEQKPEEKLLNSVLGGPSDDWKTNWHGLLDWVSIGKSVDSYLATLLPND